MQWNCDKVKVCVGGTFNKFHKGHKLLIDTAFMLSKNVVIGLTTDEFAGKRKKKIKKYETRKKSLKNRYPRAKIVPLNNICGPAATDPVMKAIVVSEETHKNALCINKKRESTGLKPLIIIIIPMVKV